ncbi:MAG: Rieske (2Fe-2S) protein, partial [bacterium]|nr:Rieske (2Fe-2S) protein [bacterium]
MGVGRPKLKIATWSELKDREPAYALVGGVDLVVIRYGEEVSVLYGRCLHRGALLSDGRAAGDNLICGVHGWDYRVDTGVSEYNNAEALHKFQASVDLDVDAVEVDEGEVRAWAKDHPQPYNRDEYQGLYADVHGTPQEPFNHYIRELSRNGLSKLGHHGQMSAMG